MKDVTRRAEWLAADVLPTARSGHAGAKFATMLTHCADDGGKRWFTKESEVSRKRSRREDRFVTAVPVVNALFAQSLARSQRRE